MFSGKAFQNFQLKSIDLYITLSLFKNIISSSTTKKAVLEETFSEL